MFEMFLGGNPHGNAPYGQLLAKTTTDFTVPAGVTDISGVAIGGGGGNSRSNTIGGSGGDLRWRNHIPVIPGEVLSLITGVVTATGKPGTASKIIRKSTGEVLLIAKGGDDTEVSSIINGADIGGGNGGAANGASGGGAGGYTGNGGKGNTAADVDSGAAGGGSSYSFSGNSFGCGGGGVYPNGKGADGGAPPVNTGSQALGGRGGSGGGSGDHTNGGLYGGGAGAPVRITFAVAGAAGCIRLIWGSGRAFPATKTTDITT